MLNLTAPIDPPSRSWQLLRVVTSLAWIVTLTLWSFYQQVYLVSWSSILHPAVFVKALILAGALDDLWWLSVLPALAFGLAWYMVTSLGWRRRSRDPGTLRVRRRVRVLVVGSLCLAVCTWMFSNRVLIVPHLMGAYDTVLIPETVVKLLFDPGDTVRQVPNPITVLMASFSLVVAVVAMQGVVVVMALERRIAPLIAILVLGISFGAAVTWLDGWYRYPLPVTGGFVRFDAWDEGLRSLASDRDPGATKATLRTYHQTHDGSGRPLSVETIRLMRRTLRGDGSLCEVAQLPLSLHLSGRGFPIQLSSIAPTSPGPALVLEVPVSEAEVRHYGTGAGDPIRTVPIEDIGSVTLDGDWVVLKADQLVRASTVIALLRGLRSKGVRRVTLAALPADTLLLRGAVLEIALEPGEGDLTVPESGYHGRGRYIPPPPEGFYERLYDGCWRHDLFVEYEMTHGLGGSVDANRHAGERVAVGAHDVPYQLLLNQLELALAWGARSAVIDETRAPFLETSYWRAP